MEARRAHASAIERVPLIAAGSRPAVVIAGRPAAEWAADAGAGRTLTLLCVEFAICHNGRVQNAGYYDLRFVMCSIPSEDTEKLQPPRQGTGSAIGAVYLQETQGECGMAKTPPAVLSWQHEKEASTARAADAAEPGRTSNAALSDR